ncbi:MAG: tyrosine-type recombinase/integrase, partial [Pseudomonadota bacterium]
MTMLCGNTPDEARTWWGKHVAPKLEAAMPDTDIAGTVEELVRKYEADELPTKKRLLTRKEYEGRIGRIREVFRTRRYAKTEAEALRPDRLGSVVLTKHLHDNGHRKSSANKDVQLLSRMFRLAIVRWGLTTHNPCAAIEYLAEPPRDTYVDDDRYLEVYDAAAPVLSYMMEISTQTGAREGMIFDIRLADFNPQEIKLRVTKKRNDRGWVTKPYEMTPDLWAALCRAADLRKKNRGGAASLPSDYLFITKQGKPYGKESFKRLWANVRKKLGLKPRELTFHDMRAKAGSDEVSDEAAKALLHHADM